MQKDELREQLVMLLMQKGFGVEGATIAADHLIANSVTVQRWIPMAEQLPTEADEDVSGCVLAIERQDGFARRWDANSVRNCPELFTYWMPLPEPPKGE